MRPNKAVLLEIMVFLFWCLLEISSLTNSERKSKAPKNQLKKKKKLLSPD